MRTVTIGVDLSKQVFSVCAVGVAGQVQEVGPYGHAVGEGQRVDGIPRCGRICRTSNGEQRFCGFLSWHRSEIGLGCGPVSSADFGFHISHLPALDCQQDLHGPPLAGSRAGVFVIPEPAYVDAVIAGADALSHSVLHGEMPVRRMGYTLRYALGCGYCGQHGEKGRRAQQTAGTHCSSSSAR